MKQIVKDNFVVNYDIKFDDKLLKEDLGGHSTNWPVTYVLYNSSKGKAYVGETTSFKNRMFSHLQDETKSDYTKALFIDYKYATKSTILHLEAFLIRGLSVSHELLSDLSNIKSNSNKHSYFNENKDEQMCINVWNTLKEIKLVNDSYITLKNKNEYKYSPYILLNEDQSIVLNDIINELVYKDNNRIVIKGASGTGKSAIAIQLFKELTDYNNFDGTITNSMVGENIDRLYDIKKKFGSKKYYSIAYIAPMGNFCSIVQTNIKKISGLNEKDLKNNNNYINDYDLKNLRVYSADSFANLYSYVKKNQTLFDLIIVDEAHRLCRCHNESWNALRYRQMNQSLGLDRDNGDMLDWVTKLGNNQVFFYDEYQSIRSSDILPQKFNQVFSAATYTKELNVEERCLGGIEYIRYIKSIFSNNHPKDKIKFDKYEFKLFDDYSKLVSKLNSKEDSLCIQSAGYFFKSSEFYNLDGVAISWNDLTYNWINSKKRKNNQIGCVHVLAGVEADYCSVIIGNELQYKDGKFIVEKSNYYDKRGKTGIDSEEQLLNYIINIYYILLTRGMKGTYVYVMDSGLREYLSKYIDKI